jgi:hypothetical protein
MSFFQQLWSFHLPLQIKDFRWLLHLALLTDLNIKVNCLNTELQCENKTIIKLTATMIISNKKCSYLFIYLFVVYFATRFQQLIRLASNRRVTSA